LKDSHKKERQKGVSPRNHVSRQDAKNAKSGSLIFFAAFAPLREIFRVLLAARRR